MSMTEPDRSRLSSQVRALATQCREGGEVTLGEVADLLQGRALHLLLVILSLPFCIPVPIPGLSTPFGMVIVLLGLRLIFRSSDGLPGEVRRRRVPGKVFAGVLRSVAGALAVLETLMAPRFSWLIDHAAGRRIAGVLITCCGGLLLLPLPVPFSNFFPAFTVVLLACAMVERDGLTALVGLAFFGLTVAFFTLLYLGGAAAIEWALDAVKELFRPKEVFPSPIPL
jgi:hypothetical protein